MKQLLITLLLLFFFSGCQDSKEKQVQHDAQVAQQARAELLAELKAKEEEKKRGTFKTQKLSKIGITTEDGKIIIDTNKTKKFFKDIAGEMRNKMQRLSKDLEQGMIRDKNAGIELDERHINIDLNKTKNFLEDFGKKVQGFVKDFDTIAKEINNTVSQ